MDNNKLRTLFWRNVGIINQIYRTIDMARIHDVGGFWLTVSDDSRAMMECLLEAIGIQHENVDLQLDEGYSMQLFQMILQAQEAEDYILMADYYEYQLLPVFLALQDRIRELLTDEGLVEPAWYEKNMEALQTCNKELYRQITEKYAIAGMREGYHVEGSNTGEYTVAYERNGNMYYLHSLIHPIREAELYADHIYREDQERYLIFGFGFGYHLQALRRIYPEIGFVVIEPDLYMIYLACIFNDLTDILPVTQFLGEQEVDKIVDAMEDETQELVIYRPSIRQITDKGLRRRLEDYVNRKDGIERHKRVFYQNCQLNIRNCDGYVDEIRDTIRGKHVIIIAGGPSLDQNVEALRDVTEDHVVIAVGTVLKKMINMNLNPDYAIAEDIIAYPQFEDVTVDTIPVLLLSTADYQIAKYYPGRKLLVCQIGYDVAARYAEEHGFECYTSGSSVTTLALDIAIRMKAKSIAFAGLDLAYTGNRFHASDTLEEYSLALGDYQVEGVHGEILPTSLNFLQYKTWIERRLREEDVTMPVYDASEGGAKVVGTRLITLKDYIAGETDVDI